MLVILGIFLQQPSLSFFASFDLICVRQIEGLLSLVQIDEVSHVEPSQGVHYVPGIVFCKSQLVQGHVL